MLGTSAGFRDPGPFYPLPLPRASSFPELALLHSLAATAFPFQGRRRRAPSRQGSPEAAPAVPYPVGQNLLTWLPPAPRQPRNMDFILHGRVHRPKKEHIVVSK